MPQSQTVMYQVEVFRPGTGWQPLGNARAKKGRAMAERARWLRIARSPAGASFTKIRLSVVTGGNSLVIVAEVDV